MTKRCFKSFDETIEIGGSSASASHRSKVGIKVVATGEMSDEDLAVITRRALNRMFEAEKEYFMDASYIKDGVLSIKGMLKDVEMEVLHGEG